MVDEEEQAKADGNEEYLNEADPSILRFLIASRDVASAEQLRDDLLGMLVAGHETTASVLTWTVYLLCQNPEAMRKVQVCCQPLNVYCTETRYSIFVPELVCQLGRLFITVSTLPMYAQYSVLLSRCRHGLQSSGTVALADATY